MNPLLTDPVKIMNSFTSKLLEDEQAYTQSAVELADAAKLEKPLDMTEREKCIYRMGLSQGLQRATAILAATKESFKSKLV
jgi:hypothetical protein